jgi:hypothetical protein
MVLSTLIPSAIHLVLALGAVLVAWSGNPLRVWAAGRLASANEADWLGPQLYLTLGWLVPAVAAPLLLLGLMGQLVGLVEPLPQALADRPPRHHHRPRLARPLSRRRSPDGERPPCAVSARGGGFPP